MRIVFLGATELGWDCCNALIEMGQNVVGIMTIPQKFNISYSDKPVENVRFKNFSIIARQNTIPIIQVDSKMSDLKYRTWLESLKPDLLIVIGWYYMVPASLRKLARLGAIGIHASLLPRLRGGAPLVWAMINGEKETGVTLFHLENGVDDGDIIGQSSFPILNEDTIADLVQKSQTASIQLIRKYIPRMDDGTAPRIKQNHSSATFVPQRKPEDGLIDWESKTSEEIYNWIRAQTHPYPGAFSYFNGKKITLWSSSLMSGERLKGIAGQVFIRKNAVCVLCSDGLLLKLKSVSIDNNEVVEAESISELFRGHQFIGA